MTTLKDRAHAAFRQRIEQESLTKAEDVFNAGLEAIQTFTAKYEAGHLPTFETERLLLRPTKLIIGRAFVCRAVCGKGEEDAYAITIMFSNSTKTSIKLNDEVKNNGFAEVKKLGWNCTAVHTGCLPHNTPYKHYLRMRIAVVKDVAEV